MQEAHEVLVNLVSLAISQAGPCSLPRHNPVFIITQSQTEYIIRTSMQLSCIPPHGVDSKSSWSKLNYVLTQLSSRYSARGLWCQLEIYYNYFRDSHDFRVTGAATHLGYSFSSEVADPSLLRSSMEPSQGRGLPLLPEA